MMDTARLFFEEITEQLAELEAALLNLEDAPGSREEIDRIFRSVHTIKGAAAMFGVDDVTSLTYDLETVLDRVRSGELQPARELFDVLLRYKDLLSEGVSETSHALDPAESEAVARGLLAVFDTLPKPEVPGLNRNPPSGTDVASTAKPERLFLVRLPASSGPPRDDTLLDGFRNSLAGLGPVRVVDHRDGPHAGEAPGSQTPIEFDILLETARQRDDVDDLLLLFDSLRPELRLLGTSAGVAPGAWDPACRKLGDLLARQGPLDAEILRRSLRSALEDDAAQDSLDSPAKLAPGGLQADQTVPGDRPAASPAGSGREARGASIRVAADKLDEVVDLVGELVIAQVRLAQIASETGNTHLAGVSEEIESLSSALRERTLGLRMLPIGTTFAKYRRLVRDLGMELGKQVDLVTEGGETELDKTVLEKLGDPLAHCLRNAMDHGVESPEERGKTGKSADGTVRLAASQSGGEVRIVIADDGRGLDPERILRRAVELGMIEPGRRPDNAELFDCVFEPGFSTADKATNISGRGVGMDVVRRSVESLRGAVEIDSAPGAGTTLTIRLPLTLAIIEGLLVGVGGERYVLPLDEVEECVEYVADRASGGGRSIPLRGSLVPLLHLREVFAHHGDAPPIQQVVIVANQDRRLGLVVDEIIGQRQTVIKSLGPAFGDVRGFSGATVMGDGSMALILDVPGLARDTERTGS